MSVGYLLLYAALAMVALWLVAELLLQHRAPLMWRLLTLGGFLGVVAGMAVGSVPVIGAGAGGFALGQVLVTLSVKRGYAAGWSLRGPDGELPGFLARVPLLSAATGGEAPAAPAEPVVRVGEVGPVEPEPEPEPVPFAATEELAGAPESVYVTQPEPAYYYQQQPEQQQYYYAEGYQYADQQYADQQWAVQQQPVYGYDQSYQQQVQYQDPYAQQQTQYQDPYGQQQQWHYPHIPEQGYQHQQQQWAGGEYTGQQQ